MNLTAAFRNFANAPKTAMCNPNIKTWPTTIVSFSFISAVPSLTFQLLPPSHFSFSHTHISAAPSLIFQRLPPSHFSCSHPHISAAPFLIFQLLPPSHFSCSLPHISAAPFLTFQLLPPSHFSCSLPRISAAPFLTFQLLASSHSPIPGNPHYQEPMTRILLPSRNTDRTVSTVYIRGATTRSLSAPLRSQIDYILWKSNDSQTDCCGRVVSEVKGYNLGPETEHGERLFVFFSSPSMQMMEWLKGFQSSGKEVYVFKGSHVTGATIFLIRRKSPNNIVLYPRRTESSNTSAETSNVARS